MTVIIIPSFWIENADVDINAWLEARGATVIQRERTRVSWRITIQQTLNQTQQDTLKGLIEAKFNQITFE